MNIIQTDIPGVVIIEPRVFGDERGYFMESFSQAQFEREVCPTVFVQDNESCSRYGVLRGLHYQLPPRSQSDEYYAPDHEGAVAWNDPTLAIDWRIPTADVVLSEKDRHHPRLEAARLFDYGEKLY